eukprot:1159131-Pelagomonas_calceolata.AAC.4
MRAGSTCQGARGVRMRVESTRGGLHGALVTGAAIVALAEGVQCEDRAAALVVAISGPGRHVVLCTMLAHWAGWEQV